VGFIVAFISALFAIKWLLKFISNHSFISFGIYRIILGILYYFIVLR
jgi:undecaprenyl-diphosphatase